VVILIIKEDYGIFFSIDASLGLIPIIILLLTVSNTNIHYADSYMEIKYFQKAQDTAELMDQYTGNDGKTILEEVTASLSENKDKIKGIESAKNITGPFLKNNLGKMKYRLVEMNFLNGKEIISNGNIEDAKVVGSAVKCCGNYLFKLYVWE
jgi:hypothetical protein